jgi:hypothetical protein
VLSFGLIGIQLPEKYKENFDVSSEGPSSGGLPKIPLQNTWVKKCTHNAPPPLPLYGWILIHPAPRANVMCMRKSPEMAGNMSAEIMEINTRKAFTIRKRLKL